MLLMCLRILPVCIADAFIQANPDENKVIDMTCASFYWRKGTRWGPCVVMMPPKKFNIYFTKLRYEKKYPLAVKLFDLMHPKTWESVAKKGLNGRYNNAFD